MNVLNDIHGISRLPSFLSSVIKMFFTFVVKNRKKIRFDDQMIHFLYMLPFCYWLFLSFFYKDYINRNICSLVNLGSYLFSLINPGKNYSVEL